MIDHCEIRITHPENPRSWSFVAYENDNLYVSMEFQNHPYSRTNHPLTVCMSYWDGYWTEYDSDQVELTLAQAKKMREFLDHFIKTEDVNG